MSSDTMLNSYKTLACKIEIIFSTTNNWRPANLLQFTDREFDFRKVTVGTFRVKIMKGAGDKDLERYRGVGYLVVGERATADRREPDSVRPVFAWQDRKKRGHRAYNARWRRSVFSKTKAYVKTDKSNSRSLQCCVYASFVIMRYFKSTVSVRLAV